MRRLRNAAVVVDCVAGLMNAQRQSDLTGVFMHRTVKIQRCWSGSLSFGARTAFVMLATCLAVAALTNRSMAAVIYSSTISTGSVENSDVTSFTNCRADQGCLGDAPLVDSNNDGVINGSDPATLVAQTFSFTLSAAERALLLGASSGVATLSVVASRDIGHKAGSAGVDFLSLSIEGSPFGTLFQDTIDSCPAGERGINYAADLVCGPNFHTDVKATDSAEVALSLLQASAGDSVLQFTLDPSPDMGRLKLFSAELIIDAVHPGATVPEPAAIVLIAIGLVAVALARLASYRRRGDRNMLVS
jgi:hypothetical protein